MKISLLTECQKTHLHPHPLPWAATASRGMRLPRFGLTSDPEAASPPSFFFPLSGSAVIQEGRVGEGRARELFYCLLPSFKPYDNTLGSPAI